MSDPVQIAGFSEDGMPILDMILRIPDRSDFDLPASARQSQAVYNLFGDVGEVSASQASAILSARDYGRQCIDRLLPRTSAEMRNILSAAVAVFMLDDDGRLADLLAWSDRRFKTYAEASAIGRTKRFPEVRAWFEILIAQTLR